MNRSGHCELCGRWVTLLTRHHLIPRTRHSNRRTQREFDPAQRRHRIAWFCRPCHDHVHALFTEKTLERQFNTLPALAAHPAVAKFVAWIRTRPDGFKPVSHSARRRA